jgi:dihydroneopterin aldolase
MSDLIRVVDLEVSTHIGVPDEERREPQRLLITLEMSVGSFSLAAQKDDIDQTVNYYAVAQRVKKFAAERPRRLLETFAEELATDLLQSFPIQHISIEIKKFILPDAAHVAVKIERCAKP